MLSAKELLEIRANKAHPRTLPAMPPKDFVPTHSAEETASINAMIEEKMTFIKEQRAEKKSLLTTAIWLPEEKVARVDHRVGGGWDTYGIEKNGKTYLQPEEALFLIELSKLELWYSGTPVSVQQAYQILLTEELCSSMKYRVYSHLCRQGYRLLRRTKALVSLKRCADSVKASSPKRLKTELPTPVKVGDTCSKPVTAKSLFQPPAAEPSDYDCIPHLIPGRESFQINFSDLQLLPENTRNRLSSYVINKKDFFTSEIESNNELVTDPTSFIATNTTNNPLFSGKTKPLMIGHLIGDPSYSSFNILTDEEMGNVEDINDLQICYDVYSPGRHFRKSNPGEPCYILAITSWKSNFPSPLSLERFKRACGPETVPLIAVAGSGSDVSFYQLKGVVSPLCA